MSAHVLRSDGGRECEQAAAVCYRIGNRGIEFLLVRTRGERWTFPKGRIEPGLTYAQTAALEAFEEAGVHGRMEEAPFARYLHRKRGAKRGSTGVREKLAVQAHLCEVLRLSPPQESRRNRTWFSAQKAKRRLLAGRAAEDGGELARVVDRAISRIERLSHGVFAGCSQKDAMQKVQFEAIVPAGAEQQLDQASFTSYARRRNGGTLPSAEIELAVKAFLCEVSQARDAPQAGIVSQRRASQRGKVLQLGPPQEITR